MTHWYSRTPKSFLEAVRRNSRRRREDTPNHRNGLEYPKQRKKHGRYLHLTETHIRHYGKPELFHTIGLAERRCYADPAANHSMKRYTYRRIIRRLRKAYPDAPLLIASWDFCMYWKPEEVRELLKELIRQYSDLRLYQRHPNDC